MITCNLEDFLRKEGWILKSYKNCGVEYFAWHKDGFQIDEVGRADVSRDWKKFTTQSIVKEKSQ